jgi:hypothetical protein
MSGRRDQVRTPSRVSTSGSPSTRNTPRRWPNITIKREPPEDAKKFDGETGKFEKYFSPEPGRATDAGNRAALCRA